MILPIFGAVKMRMFEKNFQLTSPIKIWRAMAYVFATLLVTLLPRSAFAQSPYTNKPDLEMSSIAIAQVQEEDLPLIPDYVGTIVDDLSEEFSREGPARYWHEEITGFEDHSWWTQNNESGVENKARWALDVEQPGEYQIVVYIPSQHATTRQAQYTLYHVGKTSVIVVDQDSNRNSWIVLGDFEFDGMGGEFLELTDETGESDSAFEIAVDAVGYLSADLSLEERASNALWGKVQAWLDDQTATLRPQFEEWLARQKGQILRQIGNSLITFIDQQCTGLGAAMVLPVVAFISWRKRRQPK